MFWFSLLGNLEFLKPRIAQLCKPGVSQALRALYFWGLTSAANCKYAGKMNNGSDVITPTASAPTILDMGDALESCGTCRFWDRVNVQKNGAGEALARCRRYPPTGVLSTQFQPALDARGNKVMQPVQVPATIPRHTPAGEWCGEYQIETRAQAYRGARQ